MINALPLLFSHIERGTFLSFFDQLNKFLLQFLMLFLQFLKLFIFHIFLIQIKRFSNIKFLYYERLLHVIRHIGNTLIVLIKSLLQLLDLNISGNAFNTDSIISCTDSFLLNFLFLLLLEMFEYEEHYEPQNNNSESNPTLDKVECLVCLSLVYLLRTQGKNIVRVYHACIKTPFILDNTRCNKIGG